MPGSGARPRPRCPGVLDMRESHAVRVRCSRAICATCKKVCHKSYTSGQFLVYGFYVLDVICLNGKTIWRNARYMKGEHSSTTLGKSSYQSKIILIMHQALRRRQDGEFASSRRLRAWPGGGGGGARSWTEISLSTPGPCPEAAEGSVAGRGVCSLRLAPPTSGLAQKGRQRSDQLDGEFAFRVYASRRRLRAWPGGGGGGGRSWSGSLLSTPVRGMRVDNHSALSSIWAF